MVTAAGKPVSATEPPLVSVVVPAWNAVEVLAEALASAQCQTHRQLEVLVVDDGSTDGTAEVARGFCATDPRFHLIQQSNQGAAAARNTAIQQARGSWIAFLDADDMWLPEKLARQLSLAREEPRANVLFTNFYLWDGRRDLDKGLRDNEPLLEGDISRALVFGCTTACNGLSAVMVKAETMHAVGLFDPELAPGMAAAEDWDLWLRIAEHGVWVHGTREPLARYRRWPQNATNNKLRMAECDVRMLEKNLRATQRPELRPLFEQSLVLARSNLEMARARQLLDRCPDAVPAAILRAWRIRRRPKWVMWLALLLWPKFLGGRATAAIVHRKLIQKW